MALSSIRQVSDLDTGQEKEEEAGESKAEQKESQEKNYYFHIQIMESVMLVVYGGSYPKKNERAQSRRGSTAPLQGGSACHVNIPMTVIMVAEKLVYGKGEKKGGDLIYRETNAGGEPLWETRSPSRCRSSIIIVWTRRDCKRG